MSTRFPSSDELEHWFRRPELWTGLGKSEIQRLLASQIARYGATNETERVPLLMRLYDHAVDRLVVDERLELLQSVAKMVEERKLSTNALLPFIVTDPVHAVVSTAALNLAVLMPLDNGDPLTGPKALLNSTVFGDEDVQTAVISALVLLGDARVTELLDGVWNRLTDSQKLKLTHARSQMLLAATIDFYLRWLESLDDAANAEEFGAVAAALVRMPRDAAKGTVVDAERKFPVNVNDGRPELTIINSWSVPEFGRRIHQRLKAIHAREGDPRITPHIFRAWGLEEPAEGDGYDTTPPVFPRGHGRAQASSPKHHAQVAIDSPKLAVPPRRLMWARAVPLLAVLGGVGFMIGGEAGVLVVGLLLLLGCGISDLRTGLVPDQLTLGGSALVALLQLLMQPGTAGSQILAGVVILLGLIALGVVSQLVYKAPFGGGVMKLGLLLGLVAGLVGGGLAIFLGAVVATLTRSAVSQLSGVAEVYRRTQAVPFGFYLGIAGVVTAIWGDVIVNWYRAFVGM